MGRPERNGPCDFCGAPMNGEHAETCLWAGVTKEDSERASRAGRIQFKLPDACGVCREVREWLRSAMAACPVCQSSHRGHCVEHADLAAILGAEGGA